ncbi:hypothetical protein NIES21_60650 (plasmid) [Anabaenopsis circularis NIES-21]|uniref:Uncharacterized protein n=1 Tax=Anabaenopsis circularis NIES-21 TaxID=1085406 RepID=A0A1Z4GRR0_9CYAN|nr:hypothetical protein NIES21_60650 [Anabaenopsis circularis NIES-21]
MKFSSVTVASVLTISIVLNIFAPVKPTTSQVPQLNIEEIPTNKLEIVKKRVDLIRLNGQRVKLIGRYTSKTWKPNPQSTGIADFQGLYTKSQIVLEDDTKVSIFPSGNKQSLRPLDEAESHNHQIVEAIGVVQFEAPLALNSQTRESFINLEQLRLYRD